MTRNDDEIRLPIGPPGGRGMKDESDAAEGEPRPPSIRTAKAPWGFYVKSCVVSFCFGLSTVMLIYGTGIGSYNSAVCRQRYDYPVERFGYSCRLLGFPTSYAENDVWGHNAHVYPWEFVLSVSFWSAVACAVLVLRLSRYLNNVYEAVSATNGATRWAIILELLAVPLVFLILVNDLPIRRADLAGIFFHLTNWWSILYLPLPILAGVGLLLGLGGFVRGTSIRPHGPGIDKAQTSRVSRNPVLCLPLFIAAWIVVAIMFVAFIPEVI